jgi:hypothetical protein
MPPPAVGCFTNFGMKQFTLDDFLGATGNIVHSPDPYPLRLPL